MVGNQASCNLCMHYGGSLEITLTVPLTAIEITEIRFFLKESNFFLKQSYFFIVRIQISTISSLVIFDVVKLNGFQKTRCFGNKSHF